MMPLAGASLPDFMDRSPRQIISLALLLLAFAHASLQASEVTPGELDRAIGQQRKLLATGSEARHARQALADLAEQVAYRIELAEIAGNREEIAALEALYEKRLADTGWRTDQRASAGDLGALLAQGLRLRRGIPGPPDPRAACAVYGKAAARLEERIADLPPEADGACRPITYRVAIEGAALRSMPSIAARPLNRLPYGEKLQGYPEGLDWVRLAGTDDYLRRDKLVPLTPEPRLTVNLDEDADLLQRVAPGEPKPSALLAQHRADCLASDGRPAEAAAWRRHAARLGQPAAQLHLARECAARRPPDWECVATWVGRAARHGQDGAAELLKQARNAGC